MIGHRLTSGSSFEDTYRYSRAVVLPDPAGDWILVSGTTGYDYATGDIAGDAVSQARQCFRNIEGALAQVGASLADLVRVRIYCANRDVYRDIAPVVAAACDAARPANTTVVCDLVAPEMLVEVEVTARKPA